MQPTLVIGLGGTGTGVLEDLRQRFVLHTGSADVPGIDFLYIDSDRNKNVTLTKYPSQASALTMAGNAADYANPESNRRQQLQLDKWFDLQRLNDLNNQDFGGGVGGIRMYGRLLFLDSIELPGIMQKIIIQLQELSRRDEGTPQIFVIASAGGGTGSGTFIDMGYLLGHMLSQEGMSSVSREGIVALHAPNIMTSESQMKQNSAAMLVELDYFSNPRHKFFANYDGQSVSDEVGREAPYDFISLVTPTQEGEPLDTAAAEALVKLRGKIADYLFLRILEGADDPVENSTASGRPANTQGSPAARLQDTAVNWSGGQTDTQGYPVRFMTFGVSLRQHPVGQNTHTTNRNTVAEIQRRWLSAAEPEQMYLASSRLTDKTQEQKFDSDLDELRRMLGVPKTIVQKNGDVRIFAQDTVAAQLIQVRHPTYEALIASLINAANSRSKVDDKFKWQTGMDIVPNQPGYIAGTIQTNRDEISNLHRKEGLPTRIVSYLTDISLDWNRGPRWTLRLLFKINESLENEISVLKNINLSLPAVDSAETTITTLEQAHYAESRFERELVDAKRKVLMVCQETLSLEQRRAEQFVRYLEKWQSSTGGPLAGSLDDNSLSSKIALTEAERKPIRDTLTSQDFPLNLPLNRGQLDFRPFAEIEKRANAVSAKQIKPVLEWLNEQAASNGKSIDSVASDMVRESRPLASLNLGMDGYRQMITNPTRWVACWWSESYPESRNDELYAKWYEAAMEKARGMGNLQVQHNNLLVQYPTSSPSFIGLLFLRTAFPTRILRGYEPEKRLELLGNSTAGAFSFIRSPISQAIQTRAERLLTIAMVLTWGKIEPRVNRKPAPASAAQIPQLRNMNSSGRADETCIRFDWVDTSLINRSIVLPSNFDTAAYQLALNEQALGALDKQVTSRENARAEMGPLQQLVHTHRQDLRRLIEEGQEIVDIRRELNTGDKAESLIVKGISPRNMDNCLQKWGVEKLEMPGG